MHQDISVFCCSYSRKNLFRTVSGQSAENLRWFVFHNEFKIFLSKTEDKNLFFELRLYRTSRPVWKSGKFSKSGLSGNRTFSFPHARLLTLLKIGKKNPKMFWIFFQNFFSILFQNFFSKFSFQHFFSNFLFKFFFVYFFGLGTFDTKFVSRDLLLCPVRKLICPVRSSPTLKTIVLLNTKLQESRSNENSSLLINFQSITAQDCSQDCRAVLWLVAILVDCHNFCWIGILADWS